jgi:hypothetical protein
MKVFQAIDRRFCCQSPLSSREAISSFSQEAVVAGARLHIGLPINEDLKAGSVSKAIRHQWSNVPHQIRALMEESQSSSTRSQFVSDDGFKDRLAILTSKALTLLGKGPVDLQLDRRNYCVSHSLVSHQRGTKSAYHWPRMLIPRSVAARCKEDLRVDPVDSDRPVLLLDLLLDKTTVVFCFSGNEFSGLNTGISSWKRALVLKNHHVVHLHMSQGWLSRRTHPLTRQILRSFRDEEVDASRHDKIYIYRGKLSREIALDFHVYNKSLPSILFIDKAGYVRWHAVGLPTDESVYFANNLLSKLTIEKS